MYDMSGFDYDIRDVVRVLNLQVRRKNPSSYDVDCPFCNHKIGKMNVNIRKNVFRCNYCNEQGGMLDLYAKLYGLSKAEANRQIREALNLGQYRDDYKIPEKKPEPEIPENVTVHRMRKSTIPIPCCFPILRYQKSTGKT